MLMYVKNCQDKLSSLIVLRRGVFDIFMPLKLRSGAQVDTGKVKTRVKLGACVIESLWFFILMVAVPYLRLHLVTSALLIFEGYYRSLLIFIA